MEKTYFCAFTCSTSKGSSFMADLSYLDYKTEHSSEKVHKIIIICVALFVYQLLEAWAWWGGGG
jgi:hypothetical protein